MSIAHTPLPWFQDQCAISGPGTPKGRYTYIAVCQRKQGVDPAVAVANAAFIVRAVNSYDDLLAAGQAALAKIAGENIMAGCSACGSYKGQHNDGCVVEQLRAAIAKAKGDA